jgi:hypothetical protein
MDRLGREGKGMRRSTEPEGQEGCDEVGELTFWPLVASEAAASPVFCAGLRSRMVGCGVDVLAREGSRIRCWRVSAPLRYVGSVWREGQEAGWAGLDGREEETRGGAWEGGGREAGRRKLLALGAWVGGKGVLERWSRALGALWSRWHGGWRDGSSRPCLVCVVGMDGTGRGGNNQ